MVNRRELLQRGIAATTLPLVASVAWVTLRDGAAPAASAGAVTSAPDHGPLYKVLFDRRFAAARAYGLQAEREGQPVHGFDGDITNIWYHDLHPRWQKGAVAIAGLTAHGALFCLERLAWDVGMRVVTRSEQQFKGHETLYSWVIAPVRRA